MASSTYLQQAYLAYFGRPADVNGLSFYANKTEAQVVAAFSASPESQTFFGSLDNLSQINTIYQNLFNRPAEPAGLKYWNDEINAGRLSLAQASMGILAGAQNDDKKAVVNKLAASVAFTAALDTTAEMIGYQGSAVITSARAFLASVGSDAASLTAATAQSALDSTVSSVVSAGSASSAAGSTFTLTTGVDSFTGTAGNDTINAVLGTGATLNSFDTITGGAGTDTLNIASDVAVAQTFPASVTYSGIENVNLSRSGAGTNTLAVTDTTFGTGVQSFSVTDAGNTGAGVYGVTLASAKSVSVKSTATALGAVTVTDTDATTTVTQGSALNTVTATKAASLAINGNGVTTVNINAIAGTTTITSAAGTRALAVNASGTTNQGALTDATATSAVVTVSGAQTLGLVTVAKATTVTINTNAAATTSIKAAIATSLNLGGTNLNTLTIDAATVAAASVVITGAGGVAADLTSITALTSVDTTGSTAAAPATDVLTGANTLIIGTGVAFTGGAGQDIVTVAATTKTIALGDGDDTAVVSVTALGGGGSINGGAGTNTLKLANADAVTLTTSGTVQTAFKAAVTNFSTLDITAQAVGTVSLTGFGTFNTVKLVSAAAAQIFSGAATGLTIIDTFGATGTSITTNNLSGASDVMNVTLTGGLSGAANDFGTFALPGVETVNITVKDTTATVAAQLTVLTLTDANATTINVKGNNGLALTHTGTALTTFNASGVTKGGVTLTSGVLTTDAVVTGSTPGGDTLNFSASVAKVTITETAGTNAITGSSTIASTLTGGSGADTIVGGSGKDVIVVGAGTTGNTVTGAAGADSITLTGSSGVDTIKYGAESTTAKAAGANMDTITDFVTGSDKINLTISVGTNNLSSYGLKDAAANAGVSNVATVGFTTAITDATSVATLVDVYTALATDLTAAAFVVSTALAGGINAKLVTFTNGAAAGTYLVLNDGVAAFQEDNDMVIKLVGGTTVVASDFSYTAVA